MSKRYLRWRRAVPVATLAVITAAGLATAGTAAADPSAAIGAAKGTPAPAPAKVSDAGCTLSPSLNLKSETASCIGVGATLSSVPALGRTATLTVTVKTGRAETATKVTVDLPSSLAFADATRATAAVTGAGRTSRATIATVDLAKGATQTWTRTVKAVATGTGEIKASAASVVGPGRTDGGADYVHLTVGRDAGASRTGIAQKTGDQATVATSAKVVSQKPDRPSVALPNVDVPAQRSTAAAPGTTCATGSWVFTDQNGATVGAYQSVIQVWRGGSVVASGYALGSGAYNLCWSSGGGVNTVYVRFVESNNAWKVVTNAGNDYAYVSSTVTLADGATGNFGSLQPGDGTQHRALHAYYDAAVMYDWIYQNAPGQNSNVGCWSPYGSSCRQLVVHWQSDSTVGTNWDGEVHLLAASPDSEDEPVHEYGHDLMYGLYGNSFPATTNCQPHYLLSISSTTCAWTEGFADWVPMSIWGNTIYTFPDQSTLDFNRTWNDGYDTGDQVEGRIVQALDSLNDGVKYPFDNLSGPGYRTASANFTVMRTSKPSTMAGFWSGRGSAGQDVGQGSLSALYQGTIDYGFRNPLSDSVSKTQPQAVPPHNYSYTTTRSYWSAVAVRPAAGNDSDIALYSDAGQGTLLASSGLGGSATDFVAVNSNSGFRGLQTYYPRVGRYSGTGGYTVMEAQGSNTFSSGTLTTSTASSLPIGIMDSYQNASVPVYYRAVPAAGQTLGLTFLQPGQSVLSRSGGVNSSGVAGQSVSLVATPTASGYGALVLLNDGLSSGGVTLYADTTAPTGTISIKGGAASTDKVNVPVALSATDGETGPVSMQVSTDGTFDTEPVVAYATSATVKLPGLNGDKTVSVRYLNNAGMWSAPVSDSITLLVKPTATTVTPASGPAAGGTTVTVKGTRFTGATAVKFGTKAATSYTVVNDATIRAVAPSGAGTVSINVTVPAGTVASTGTFRYIPGPVVTSIAPKTGPTGTVVTVNGSNFTGATKVQFGTVLGTNVVVVNATKLTVKAPAGSGLVNIRVTTPGGLSPIVPADRFTYTP